MNKTINYSKQLKSDVTRIFLTYSHLIAVDIEDLIKTSNIYPLTRSQRNYIVSKVETAINISIDAIILNKINLDWSLFNDTSSEVLPIIDQSNTRSANVEERRA